MSGEWTINIKITVSEEHGVVVEGDFSVKTSPTDSIAAFLDKCRAVEKQELGVENGLDWKNLRPFDPSKLGEFVGDTDEFVKSDPDGVPDCTFDASKATVGESGLHDGATLETQCVEQYD